MKSRDNYKIRSLVEFWDRLPDNERIIVDILRQIILENIPPTCKEKLSWNVPFYQGRRGICIIWPASIPRGGIKSGVLLGFVQGYKLKDVNKYLIHGTNKKIYYKIFHSVNEINVRKIITLLMEAVKLDSGLS